MNKKFLFNYLFTAVLLSMLAVFNTACGSDNDSKDEPSNDPSQVSIVGTWRLIFQNSPDYDQMILKKDGTGLGQEWELINGKMICRDEYNISYVYNKQAEKLTIVEIEDGDVDEYEVVLLNATQLVLRPLDYDGTEVWTRVK